MITIPSSAYSIEVGALLDSSLEKLLETRFKHSKKVILADENTCDHCVSHLTANYSELSEAEIIVIPAGEEHKTLEICAQVWETLSDYSIQRSDLIIHVGGGVTTDLGGFIASVYKRGIRFINIPTSLLAMVDASSGGKTGVDLMGYKNQIGTFTHPELVVCDPEFLITLPPQELLWGRAEMLKHGLIADAAHWKVISDKRPEEINAEDIAHSVAIKNAIVQRDFTEQNERKKLNFGHTIGHALEGFMLNRSPLPHGQCVAWGILAESLLAHKFRDFPREDVQKIEGVIQRDYPKIELRAEDIAGVLQLMHQDKKNRGADINFVCIESIGNVSIDSTYTIDQIEEVITSLFVCS